MGLRTTVMCADISRDKIDVSQWQRCDWSRDKLPFYAVSYSKHTAANDYFSQWKNANWHASNLPSYKYANKECIIVHETMRVLRCFVHLLAFDVHSRKIVLAKSCPGGEIAYCICKTIYTEWAIKNRPPTCQLIMSSKSNVHLKWITHVEI